MVRRSPVLVAALLALGGCTLLGDGTPSPSIVPRGVSPREAVLGRPPTDTDCFAHAFVTVQLPDPLTLERHVKTAAMHPAWLPSTGFLGSVAELVGAVGGQLIDEEPQSVWVLVASDGRPRADRYFAIRAATGERVWYRDATLAACG